VSVWPTSSLDRCSARKRGECRDHCQLIANGACINRHPDHGIGADGLQRLDFFERADSAGDDEAS